MLSEIGKMKQFIVELQEELHYAAECNTLLKENMALLADQRLIIERLKKTIELMDLPDQPASASVTANPQNFCKN